MSADLLSRCMVAEHESDSSPVPAAVAIADAIEYDSQKYGLEVVTFTQRTNTKRVNFFIKWSFE